MDNVSGIQVLSYEGRALSSIRIPSVRAELLKSGNCDLSGDALLVVDSHKPTGG